MDDRMDVHEPARSEPNAPDPSRPTVSDRVMTDNEFRTLFTDRSRLLLKLATLLAGHKTYDPDKARATATEKPDGPTLDWTGDCTRPLLGDVYEQSARAEELLDSYGARTNLEWRRLRSSVAGLKLFSDVAYKLLHMSLFLPRYRLLPTTPDFKAETQAAFAFTCRILSGFARVLLDCAAERGIPVDPLDSFPGAYAETLPPGELPQNCGTQSSQSVEETVVYLATAFLNVAEDGKFLQVRQRSGRDYGDLVPDPINEEDIRTLEETFHSLQARYDTYVADTNLESMDTDLLVLRGHITVLYHLLETGTELCHYYERHVRGHPKITPGGAPPVVDAEKLLAVLVDYSIAFTDIFIEQTRGLCHQMLRRYSVPGKIEVPVPRYRGFHVRPSTLVAKIVRHYGSRVTMCYDDEQYDAGVTLDLFRANEKLNAEKRRRIAGEAVNVLQNEDVVDRRSREEVVRTVARRLFEQRKLVLYDRMLSMDTITFPSEAPPEQYVVQSLNKLLTLGKIDVEVDAHVSFHGDRRVLSDIELLAEQNYGEDDFGNNLPLPEDLAYLRK